MCGIVGGMSSTLNQSELNKIKGLMIMSCFRGMFGSGSMVVVPKKKVLQVLTHKTELCAAELMCDEDFLGAINQSPKIVVTHARAPTKGSNDLQFVHPHRSRHITGVHNGTMHRVMDKVIGTDESDSAAVFAAIAEHGVESFIKESRGAFSLVWLDTKDGTLNFLRNDQRPMVLASVGYQDRTSTMYFASELGMLQYVLARDGAKLADVRFESPKTWQHVSYPMDVSHNIQPLEMKQYSDPIVTKSYSSDGWNMADWQEYMDSDNVTPISKKIEEKKREAARQSRLPMVLNQIPRDAMHLQTVEDILKRRAAPSATFRAAPDNRHAMLLRSGPCCVCDDTPSVHTLNGITVYPHVHEVKFGTGYPQYICDKCVNDGNPIALSVLDTSATKH